MVITYQEINAVTTLISINLKPLKPGIQLPKKDGTKSYVFQI